MLDAGVILIPKVVKAQTVHGFIHDRAQLVLQLFTLRGIQQALENGVLHALPIVHALLCDLAQRGAAACARSQSSA